MSKSPILLVIACVVSFLLGAGVGRYLRHHKGLLLLCMLATIAGALGLMVAPPPAMRDLLVTALLLFVIGVRFALADRRAKH